MPHYYNRRDLIGHWVKKEQRKGQMCSHACCRGKRVHPENYPVILPDTLLHKATDEDLAEGYNRGSDRRQAQILHEMDRRDNREKRRHAARIERQRKTFARRTAKQEEVDRLFGDAEDATRGNMLNRAGKANDIDEKSLFTGPESRARRYASEELLNHWQSHPRPTGAHFAGRDTTLGPQYTAPRKRHKVTTPRRAA
jgi:hypothetical protein